MCKTALELAKSCAIRELLHNLNPCRSRAGGCWPWPKYKNNKGYGVILFDGFKFPVHRLSFEHFKGLIPRGEHVMHECDNPPCWNPDHLFLGTHAENMADMKRKGRSRRKSE